MRFLIYGINYAPEQTSTGKYNTELCEYLQNANHEVTMVTAFPYYPEWKIPEKYRYKAFETERRNGVNVKRSYLYVPSQVTPIRRILHELSFILTSFFNLITSGKLDVMIVVSPPLSLGVMAYVVCKLRRLPLIFHVQDLQPDTAIDLGMMRNNLFVNYLFKIEKFIYRVALMVSTISEGMRKRIISKEIPPDKTILFPNWVDTDFIRPLERDNIFRKNNGLNGKFLVLYSGNIGIKQGLDIILDIAYLGRNVHDIVYLVVGDGAYRQELFRRYKKMGLTNVMFLPVQPYELLPYMLSAADVSLIPQKSTVTDIVMPSKLTGILASGRSVIVSARPGSEIYNVIKSSGCGMVVEPENADQMFSAVMDLYNNRDKAEECGRRGREYALKNFSKKSILKAFEERVVGLVTKHQKALRNLKV